MAFGVIADTHDNLRAAATAVERFAAEGIETVVHCGDVIAPPRVPAFEGLEFHLVFGNNDGDRAGLREAVEGLGKGSRCHGRFARLEFGDRSVAVLHGEDLREVRGYAETGAFEYVLHGHHHEARAIEVDGTTILNPGAHFPRWPSGIDPSRSWRRPSHVIASFESIEGTRHGGGDHDATHRE